MKIYIPGDLVMTNGKPIGTAKCVVYRVTASNPIKELKLVNGTVLRGTVNLENIEGTELGDKGYLFAECCAWVKNIVPIKLLPEILEENGWKKVNEKPVNCNDKYVGHGITLFHNLRNNTYRYGDFTVMVHIHDLQHLLFGLGLDSNLKV